MFNSEGCTFVFVLATVVGQGLQTEEGIPAAITTSHVDQPAEQICVAYSDNVHNGMRSCSFDSHLYEV